MRKAEHAAAAYKKNGFFKTSVDTSSDSGYLKAAKFLLLVGPEQAAEVLKKFTQEEIERIVKEISQIRKLDNRESASILKEFGKSGLGKKKGHKPTVNEIVEGGPGKAKEMLYAAFGNEKGQTVFDKVLPFGGRTPFDFMNELQPEQILVILKNEPPYVLSIVLSFLDPGLSSRIITKLPPESRKEIVMRIARQGKVAPGVIEKMECIFRDRIRTQGKIVSDEVDGKSVLAGILKYMDIRAEENILDGLSDGDNALAGEIRDRIYTIDILLRMDNRDVQYLLRDFENSELAIIIKGKPDDIKARILDNISERRRLLVEEESCYLGEMLKSDVDKATRELINYLIDLEQKGSIIIPRSDEEYI